MAREWNTSVERLSAILEFPVRTASVPGGFTSPAVESAAARAGIRHLFTSEPTSRVHRRGDCLVYGRFAILRDSTPKSASDLLAGKLAATFRQSATWRLKKWAKLLGGSAYLRIRNRLVGHEPKE